MAIVFLGLGSNLGDREKNIQNAVRLLQSQYFVVDKISTLIETEPVGFLGQRKFLNAVLKGATQLSPVELLLQTQSIEKNSDGSKPFSMAPARSISIFCSTIRKRFQPRN